MMYCTLTLQFIDLGDLRTLLCALVVTVFACSKGFTLGAVPVLAALAGAVL